MQAGFRELYGDKYHIDVVDLATEHSPYPFNQASKSYNTMVRRPSQKAPSRAGGIAGYPLSKMCPVGSVAGIADNGIRS